MAQALNRPVPLMSGICPGPSSIVAYRYLFVGSSARNEGLGVSTTWTKSNPPSRGSILNTEMPVAVLGTTPPGATFGAVYVPT